MQGQLVGEIKVVTVLGNIDLKFGNRRAFTTGLALRVLTCSRLQLNALSNRVQNRRKATNRRFTAMSERL